MLGRNTLLKLGHRSWNDGTRFHALPERRLVLSLVDFVSSARPKGDYAGVYEYDGETAYFYLYKTCDDAGGKVADQLLMFAGKSTLREEDVRVGWDASSTKVGLFLRGCLWATYNLQTGMKFGGNYSEDGFPLIPKEECFVS